MKVTNARKVGFWAALAMALDSMIGIGMFVKNYAVTANVGQQGWAILATWIIGAVISFTMLISYLEIFKIKTVKVHGMAAFAERCVGPRFGYFVRFNLPMLYMPILQLALGFYFSEFLFQGIHYFIKSSTGVMPAMPPIYVNLIIGLVLVLFFQVVNFYSAYSGGAISLITVSIKFIPIIIAVMAGFIMWHTNNGSKNFDTGLSMQPGVNWFTQTNNKALNVNGILMAAPAILFSYDQFLSTAASVNKIEKGQATVSKVTVVALIITTISYIFVSAAQIIHGSTSVPMLLSKVFPESQHNIWYGVGRVFIALAILGSLNFLCHSNANVTEQAIRSETFVGVLDLREKISVRWLSFIYYLASIVIWIIILFVPSIVLNTDEIIDEASNLPSLFFFGIYAITLFGYAWNRDKIRVKRINNFVFWTCFVIAELLVWIIVAYQVIYDNTIHALTNPNDHALAGLLYEDKKLLTNWRFFLVFILMVILFFGTPILNAFLVRKIEKRHVTRPTQDNQLQVLEWNENHEATETQEYDLGWMED